MRSAPALRSEGGSEYGLSCVTSLHGRAPYFVTGKSAAGNAVWDKCCSERMMAVAAPWVPQIGSGSTAAAPRVPASALPRATPLYVTNSRRDKLCAMGYSDPESIGR